MNKGHIILKLAHKYARRILSEYQGSYPTALRIGIEKAKNQISWN